MAPGLPAPPPGPAPLDIPPNESSGSYLRNSSFITAKLAPIDRSRDEPPIIPSILKKRPSSPATKSKTIDTGYEELAPAVGPEEKSETVRLPKTASRSGSVQSTSVRSIDRSRATASLSVMPYSSSPSRSRSRGGGGATSSEVSRRQVSTVETTQSRTPAPILTAKSSENQRKKKTRRK